MISSRVCRWWVSRRRAISLPVTAVLLLFGCATNPGVRSASKSVAAEPSSQAASRIVASRIDVPGTGKVVGPDRRLASATGVEGNFTIDGVLDEPQWQQAIVQSGFWQREPNEGETASFRTEFRIVYDSKAIYVGVRALDPNPEKISARLTRRDQESSSDFIYISFDSYLDKRTAFTFGLSAAGVQRDILKYDDTKSDSSWNAVWEGASKIGTDGWVAEYRIPFSQLRYSGAKIQRWGLQVTRFVQRVNEVSMWVAQPRDSGREVSLYGALDGLVEIAPARRFEIVPYAKIGAGIADVNAADPLNNDGQVLPGAGVDFKYGLGSNFTLSGAINPDFGQVEADPSEVNLSANETFFAEKRSFFLEGTDLFNVRLRTQGGGNAEGLFYSRRIGAAPHDSGRGRATYFSEPTGTTILGAAKLSGKTAGGWSFGVLEAVTAEESAQLADGPNESEHSSRVIEPLTNFSMLRVVRELNEGNTKIGVVGTGVHRSLDGTELSYLHSEAYSGGFELSHRWGQGDYEAAVKILASHVRGDAVAIDTTQRGPQRYYQRPDADHLDYDPTRESLSGMAFAGSVGKWSGGHWRYGTGFDSRTPGFEVNDLGFQRSGDYITPWVYGQYWDTTPGKHVRSFQVNGSLASQWDYSGRNMNRELELETSLTLLNYWSGYLGMNVVDSRWSNRDLRGGPLLRRDLGVATFGGISSDQRKNLTFNLNALLFVAPVSSSFGSNINPSLTWQAKSNLSLEIGPGFAIGQEDNQYVSEVIGSDGEVHYVMAKLKRVGSSLTLRANYTLSPTVSFQIYAQPFFASGAYSDYKDVVAPRALKYDNRYRTFTDSETQFVDGTVLLDSTGDGVANLIVGKPDFRFGELRSTAVARWEYLPGSSLFFIWSHNRSSFAADGRFTPSTDYKDLAKSPGEHVLLLKLNYWIGV